jgi:hypothetical protein
MKELDQRCPSDSNDEQPDDLTIPDFLRRPVGSSTSKLAAVSVRAERQLMAGEHGHRLDGNARKRRRMLDQADQAIADIRGLLPPRKQSAGTGSFDYLSQSRGKRFGRAAPGGQRYRSSGLLMVGLCTLDRACASAKVSHNKRRRPRRYRACVFSWPHHPGKERVTALGLAVPPVAGVRNVVMQIATVGRGVWWWRRFRAMPQRDFGWRLTAYRPSQREASLPVAPGAPSNSAPRRALPAATTWTTR